MDRIDRHWRGRNPAERGWHVFGAPSNYVFISHSSADHLLPIVDLAERVGRTLGNDALMLFDTSEQVQAVLQERWLASTELPKGIDLSAVVLTPGFANRLGLTRTGRTVGAAGVVEIYLSHWDVDHLKSFEELFHTLTRLIVHGDPSQPPPLTSERRPGTQDILRNSGNHDVGELIGLRKRLRERVPMLDSEQWAKWRGVTTNPSATLAKYREQGRLFAVREGRNYLYPRFQFTQDASPLDALVDVLKVVPEDARGWPLLSWFEAPSGLLGGRKPIDVLAQDPAAVRDAAVDFYADD
jgi:hypothetical protein